MIKSEHRPVLIVIAGPNGSGKTTITSQILRHEWMENAIYINPDQIAKDIFGDWNSKEAVIKAIKHSQELRENCLQNHKSLIFETVLSAPDKVDYIKRAKEAGFFVRLFFVSTNHPSINASRVARRVLKGGHDVPIPKIISRYYKSILNCRRVACLIDRTYVYDNSEENSNATLLFRMTNGKVVKKYVSDIPEWAQSILG